MEDDLNPSQLSTRLQEIVSSFVSLSAHVEERIELLRVKENHFKETKKKMEEPREKAENQIDLNVGGMRLSASKSTLLSVEGSYFYVMLSSDRWKPNSKGEYFIDRDFTHFPRILNYLRTGELELNGLNEIEMEKLNKELDYYQISPPIQRLQNPIEPLRWDPYTKGMDITLSGDGKIAEVRRGSGSVLAISSVPSFSIKVLSFGFLYLGLVPHTFIPDKDDLKSSGWYLDFYRGRLYSQADDGRPYTDTINKDDIVTVHHNKQRKTINFSINGENKGVAFRDVPSDVELYPFVKISQIGFTKGSVQIVN